MLIARAAREAAANPRFPTLAAGATREICITFQKTRAELAEISLRRVMHPLLFPAASTV